MSLREVLTSENWMEQRSSENQQYAWFVAVFLQTATPWFIDTCEVSLMSNSSEIVAEAEGPDRERSRGRRMRNLDWWPVRVGHGGVGCLYAEEGGRRSGVRERPGVLGTGAKPKWAR